ncbi:hypothetical protein ACTWP4_06005 [Gracilibacillus sp. D59]|uniref:hypothetical protein n=1 Tax=Gracilibacillus sp. D59 TaxID=3457434 RepID=UPI003FCDC38D
MKQILELVQNQEQPVVIQLFFEDGLSMRLHNVRMCSNHMLVGTNQFQGKSFICIKHIKGYCLLYKNIEKARLKTKNDNKQSTNKYKHFRNRAQIDNTGNKPSNAESVTKEAVDKADKSSSIPNTFHLDSNQNYQLSNADSTLKEDTTPPNELESSHSSDKIADNKQSTNKHNRFRNRGQIDNTGNKPSNAESVTKEAVDKADKSSIIPNTFHLDSNQNYQPSNADSTLKEDTTPPNELESSHSSDKIADNKQSTNKHNRFRNRGQIDNTGNKPSNAESVTKEAVDKADKSSIIPNTFHLDSNQNYQPSNADSTLKEDTTPPNELESSHSSDKIADNKQSTNKHKRFRNRGQIDNTGNKPSNAESVTKEAVDKADKSSSIPNTFHLDSNQNYQLSNADSTLKEDATPLNELESLHSSDKISNNKQSKLSERNQAIPNKKEAVSSPNTKVSSINGNSLIKESGTFTNKDGL